MNRLSVRPLILGAMCAVACVCPAGAAGSMPIQATRGMVVSQQAMASEVGAAVLREGGNAVDAAVATAFALAVTHPAAGNIGGGGFMICRSASGDAVAYDFREMAPARAVPDMWLDQGDYREDRHHEGYGAVGVPGSVAGLHLAWKEQGKLPWKRLLRPAIALARDGFEVSYALASSLQRNRDRFEPYAASIAQFTRNGVAYVSGDTLRQPELAATLERIAEGGPVDFYAGHTARLMVKAMEANGGLMTLEDLKAYRAVRRRPIVGDYRGFEIIGMPPPSSGGTVLVEMLNILEGYPLREVGFGAAENLHRMIETMRRAYADRARYLGDPDFNLDMPIERLTSKDYAASLRATISPHHATRSSLAEFVWPEESDETTHLSVVDAQRNAVALTTTLEYSYGSGIVIPGAGFLLNNEMGDFNAGAGLTTTNGLIGTAANLAAPHKRMLSSMTPTIIAKDGELVMVTGSPGGRSIINTVLQTILNFVDHGMNAQEAVDAPRLHHQWWPDEVRYERHGFSPDTLARLGALGHQLRPVDRQGVAEVIVRRTEDDVLEGGLDRRAPDGGGAGY